MAQDFPLEPVPEEARVTPASLSFVLLGFTFFTATMFAGGKVGVAFSGSELGLLIFLGNLILGVYAAALAVIAFRSGLTTALMSRYAFGTAGSGWSDFLLGFTQIGWYAWGTGTVAAVSIELLGLPQSWLAPLIIFFGFFFCLTAYIGYRGLDLLARVTVPLMAGLILWSAWKALGSEPVGATEAGMGYGEALTLIVGTFVSGATQSTNWTRFANSQRAAVGTTLLAFLIGNGLMIVSGALGAYYYGESDLVKVFASQGIIFWAAVMLFGNIWTTQDNTIYNFSVAGCHLFRTPERRRVTLAGAAVGTALALFGFADLLVPFLLTLGKIIPPLGGVILADYFIRRKGNYPELSSSLPKWDVVGFIAYGLGVLASYAPLGVAPVNGVIVAALSTALISRFWPSP